MENHRRFIGIVGTGSYLPKRELSNFDLERLVDTSNEWIYEKTGIKTRRIADDEEGTSTLAIRAAQAALDDAGIQPKDVDLIVVATSSPDSIQPSTACLIQESINAYNAAAFDISAVCTGFVYAMTVAADMMKGNDTYKTVLVIGAETYSKILDWTDRTTCIYFGDGAGAVVLQDVEPNFGILSSYIRADGKGKDVIYFPSRRSRWPNLGNYDGKPAFKMQGKKVWDFVNKAFPDAVIQVLKRANMTISNVDIIISHQANARLIEACVSNLGLPMSKTFMTVEKYANTSGASIPITLDEACRAGKIKYGDILILVGFGGGLTWAANLIKWNGRGE